MKMKKTTVGWIVAAVGATIGVIVMWVTNQFLWGVVLVVAAGLCGEYIYIKDRE